jgi:hypothetical protein
MDSNSDECDNGDNEAVGEGQDYKSWSSYANVARGASTFFFFFFYGASALFGPWPPQPSSCTPPNLLLQTSRSESRAGWLHPSVWQYYQNFFHMLFFTVFNSPVIYRKHRGTSVHLENSM